MSFTILPVYQKVPELISSVSSQPADVSFQSLLGGKKAFYHEPDYLQTTRRDLSQIKSVSASYKTDTEYKIVTIFKRILSYLFFPVAIYNWLHAFAAKIILPASNSKYFPENYAEKLRESISLNGEWKYKRINVEVDGYKIDAVIVGTASTLSNGRWVLASNGNAEFYEAQLSSPNFTQMLSAVQGNGLVFNYPGVGESSGPPGRQAMEKAYKAMLRFLEDKKGIGAKEIIGYGHSIGGGVQGDALRSHELQKDVKYVFIKSRTFSSLSDITAVLTRSPLLALFVKILGWNIESTTSSKKLQAPEIIMQTAEVATYEELQDSAKVIDDGVIPAQVSLAKALLDDLSGPKKNKVFMGMPEFHNEELIDPSFLARTIERLLKV